MTLPSEQNIAHSKLYNLHVINKMCRGNEEQILQMVEVFISQITQSIKEIGTAYSENNFSEIKSLTHKIKPLLTYFGTSKLEEEFLLTEVLFAKEIASLEVELKITNLDLLAKEVILELKNDFSIIDK